MENQVGKSQIINIQLNNVYEEMLRQIYFKSIHLKELVFIKYQYYKI